MDSKRYRFFFEVGCPLPGFARSMKIPQRHSIPTHSQRQGMTNKAKQECQLVGAATGQDEGFGLCAA